MKSFKPLQHPLFIGCAVLFITHQVLQKIAQIPLPWIDSHLDCLLCMPLLFTGWLLERRIWVYHDPTYCLPGSTIVLATLALILIFELGFPAFSSRFTADWKDIPAYLAGSFLFWRYLNK